MPETPESPAVGPLKRAERGQRVKDKVLAEAATLFGERGFDGVTLDEIAERSGATRSLILYHFSTKEGVWTHAVERVAEDFHTRFARRLASTTATTDPERLHAMVAISIDVMSEVPEYGQILVREGARAGPRLDWLVRCFSPPALRFDNPALTGRIRFTLLRDVLIGSILTITTLGSVDGGVVVGECWEEVCGATSVVAGQSGGVCGHACGHDRPRGGGAWCVVGVWRGFGTRWAVGRFVGIGEREGACDVGRGEGWFWRFAAGGWRAGGVWWLRTDCRRMDCRRTRRRFLCRTREATRTRSRNRARAGVAGPLS